MKRYWNITSRLVRVLIGFFAVWSALAFLHHPTTLLLFIGAVGALLSLVPAIHPKRWFALGGVTIVMAAYLLRALLLGTTDSGYLLLMLITFLLTVCFMYFSVDNKHNDS